MAEGFEGQERGVSHKPQMPGLTESRHGSQSCPRMPRKEVVEERQPALVVRFRRRVSTGWATGVDRQ